MFTILYINSLIYLHFYLQIYNLFTVLFLYLTYLLVVHLMIALNPQIIRQRMK